MKFLVCVSIKCKKSMMKEVIAVFFPSDKCVDNLAAEINEAHFSDGAGR